MSGNNCQEYKLFVEIMGFMRLQNMLGFSFFTPFLRLDIQRSMCVNPRILSFLFSCFSYRVNWHLRSFCVVCLISICIFDPIRPFVLKFVLIPPLECPWSRVFSLLAIEYCLLSSLHSWHKNFIPKLSLERIPTAYDWFQYWDNM